MLTDFLEKYFIEPTITKSGYNIVNSVTYIAILIVSLFIAKKLLKKLKIQLNDKLWNDLLPFVFVGGILRALEDISFWDFLGVYNALFITPLIYVVIFVLAFASVLISKYFWQKFTRYFGLALLAVFLIMVATNVASLSAIPIILAIFSISYLGFYFVQKFLKFNIIKSFKSDNSQILGAHLLDASAAFVSVSVIGGYFESSVGSSFVFMHLPTWSFIILKGVAMLVILNMLDKDGKNDWSWLIKFTLLFLGLGPAVHNIFTLIMS